VLAAAEQRGVLAGLSLARDYPELDGALLVAVTEMNIAEDVARLCEVLKEVR
jgi:hypothetical protein